MTVEPPDYPYRLLAARLRAGIEAGEIGPRLPSIHELAAQHEMSTNTVQRALRMLKDEGRIYGINGLGMFVKNPE